MTVGAAPWYMDEKGERKRKSFSGTTKAEVTKKMTDYVAAFNDVLQESDESRKTLMESMTHWLQVFKFPSVERTTYDRCECTVEHQIFPLLGEKVVGDITAADLKEVLNHWMSDGYAYTTVKKVYIVLNEYFRYLTQQEILQKNPMNSVPMIKKSNFMAAQNKEDLPTQETVTVFTSEEIEKFEAEAFSKILKAAGIEQKGLHSLRHTFGSSLVNGIRQPDGTLMALSPRQVADLLGHSTSQITEMYYVKKDTPRLQGITDGFNF